MKKQTLVFLGMLAFAGSAQTASASSSAQAFIDWDNISFKLVDYSGGLNAPTLNWSSKNGTVSTSATTVDPNDSGSANQTRNNFTTALSSETDTLFAQSSAARNSTGLSASASSQMGASEAGVNFGINAASASASNSGNFQLGGNGLLLISMDWGLSSTGPTGDLYFGGIGEWASSSISISGSYSGQFTSGNASASYTTTPYWSFGGPESQSSTFVMAIFNPGLGIISGSISALVSASTNSSAFVASLPASPVPLPTSAWLFGSALFGFLAQRKRRFSSAI